MKFTQVTETEIKEKGLVASDAFDTLNAFSQSGMRCVKLNSYPHKTANICASAFRAAIKRYKRHHIKVMVRKNDVYLINTLID
jgi:hypothetical protein